MKILIAGGTGYLGTQLTTALLDRGHKVTILSRSPRKSERPGLACLQWDGTQIPPAASPADAMICLTGANIAGHRWTAAFKKKIHESRILPTRACVEFIARSQPTPTVFLSASAIGYYGGYPDGEQTESSPAGRDYLGQMCSEWEAEAVKANCRTLLLRTGVVLGRGGEAFQKLKTVFKLGLGGRMGSGTQGFGWIHIEDWVSGLLFVLEEAQIAGPINLSAPRPCNQMDFARTLARAVHRPAMIPAPRALLQLIFGELSILFWGGQMPRPQKLLEAGFAFRYPELQASLEQLLGEG